MKFLVVGILALSLSFPSNLLAGQVSSVGYSVPFENLIEKGYSCSSKASKKQVVVSYESDDLTEKWHLLIGGEPDPRIDISKEIVIFILYGTAPNTSYSLTVKDVKQHIYYSKSLNLLTNSIIVTADVISATGFSGQAITYPCAILRIPKFKLLLIPQLPKPQIYWQGNIIKPFSLQAE